MWLVDFLPLIVNKASLSFIFFRVLSVSSMPGMGLVVFALCISCFSKIAKRASLSLLNSFLVLWLFCIVISAFLSISKTLSLSEKSERGNPCAVRCCMASARAAL